MKYLIFIIILITEAPVFSGASAQLVDTFDFSSLVKIIKETDKPNPAKAVWPSDTVPHKASSPKSVTNNKTLSTNNRNTLSSKMGNTQSVQPDDVLDNIIKTAKNNSISPKRQASSSSVLEFMTKVYADHGFYQSGHWDDAEDWSALTRNIVLPPYNPADFYRPVWGQITSTYGYRPKFGRIHKGIDLAVHIGDTVRAALPGVVAKVAYDPRGYGHYVVLVHNNGMETRYAHLQAPISTLGETLSAGDPLGLGGNTGNSTGPHLHFEVRYRGTALDPASLFNFYNLTKRGKT